MHCVHVSRFTLLGEDNLHAGTIVRISEILWSTVQLKIVKIMSQYVQFHFGWWGGGAFSILVMGGYIVVTSWGNETPNSQSPSHACFLVSVEGVDDELHHVVDLSLECKLL